MCKSRQPGYRWAVRKNLRTDFLDMGHYARPWRCPNCRQGVTCVAYGPLGHGKEGLLTHPEIEKVAQEVGKTPAQVRVSAARRRPSGYTQVVRFSLVGALHS